MDRQPEAVLPAGRILRGNPQRAQSLLGLTPGLLAPCMVLFGAVFHCSRQTYFSQYVDFTQHKSHCPEIKAWAMLSLGGPSVSGMAAVPSSVTNVLCLSPLLISSTAVSKVSLLSVALGGVPLCCMLLGYLSCGWCFDLKRHVQHLRASTFNCSAVRSRPKNGKL